MVAVSHPPHAAPPYLTPTVHITNPNNARSALGLVAHPGLLKALTNEEDATAPILEIYIDSPIGPPGLRAFCAALLVRVWALLRCSVRL